jgi:ankyrin repeat protein
LQIKQLLDLQRPGEILDRLGKLPKDLKQTYDEIYNGMEDHEKKIADRAFQWVMCAVKPLKTKVLLPAICQDENSDTLAPLDGLDEGLALEYCHNLLIIDPVRKVWVPSHLSVIEYIEDRWSLSQANCLVSSICLFVLQNTVLYSRENSWLCSRKRFVQSSDLSIPKGNRHIKEADSSEEEDDSEEDTSTGAISSDSSIGEKQQNTSIGTLPPRSIEQIDPLHEEMFHHLSFHARHYWMLHAQRSAKAGNTQRVSALLYEFLGHPSESSPAYRFWLSMVNQDYTSNATTDRQLDVWKVSPKQLVPNSAASFVYCLFDLAIILPDWHDFKWIELDQTTSWYDEYSCLQLAAIGGSCHTCRELIKHGALVNKQTESSYGSALAAAAYYRYLEVVEFLVKEGGADVNLQLKYGHYGSALAAAAAAAATESYSNREVIEFLVKEGGADINLQLQYGKYGSALAAAASTVGAQEVVEFLVKEGGADVNLQLRCGNYGSALAAAANYGNREVAEFLVKKGRADVNLQLQCGIFGSALAAAATCGATSKSQEVLEFLVENGGADVNLQLQCGYYGSALAAAAACGASSKGQEVLEFLVEKGGADVNLQLQCGYYGSALAAAASSRVAEFLVKKGGVDVNLQLQCGYYGSALAAAATESYENRGVVEFLVKERGADVNMQLQYGNYGSALAVAACYGNREVIEFLVKEGGADINLQLQYGEFGSALAAAAAAIAIDDNDDDKLRKIIEFLVEEAGAEVNMQLEHGKYMNALDAAEKNGRSERAQLLIELGAIRQEQQHMALKEEETFDTELDRLEGQQTTTEEETGDIPSTDQHLEQ